ncbi:MAG: hypothetical protein Q8Q28_05690 [Pseudomonadota bacterium]|nr:hypothetical protein [Pseudomonadota bacterium]
MEFDKDGKPYFVSAQKRDDSHRIKALEAELERLMTLRENPHMYAWDWAMRPPLAQDALEHAGIIQTQALAAKILADMEKASGTEADAIRADARAALAEINKLGAATEACQTTLDNVNTLAKRAEKRAQVRDNALALAALAETARKDIAALLDSHERDLLTLGRLGTE